MTVKAGAGPTRRTAASRSWTAARRGRFGPPLHVHPDEDEGFYVLEGELAVRCGDEDWTASAGSFVLLPRAVPHAFAVTGGRDCRLLQITTPERFEGFVAEAGRPAASRTLPEPSAPDVPTLARIGARVGNELVGPPLAVGG